MHTSDAPVHFFFIKLQFINLTVEYHKPNKYWNSVMPEQVCLKEIKDVPNQTKNVRERYFIKDIIML